MYCLPENILKRLLDRAGAEVISGGLRGLEKESLRIDQASSRLAQTPHPKALGAALTHPFITTDFAESLLEFVTPAVDSNQKAIRFLTDLHKYTYDQIMGEMLWPCSMPCGFTTHAEVPLARYGSSNVGQMKTVYRRGLGLRYGRIMQTIAGVHFNYSLPQQFWPALQAELGNEQNAQEFQSTGYFGLIRNFKRISWLVLYLFGSSPAVCKSFFQGAKTGLAELDGKTSFGAHATSLRMSDIGYSNHAQASLNISVNSLAEYVAGLTRAISTPHAPYEALGLYDGEKRLQLSTNILQIANEFYSVARPKRVARSGEEPTAALRRRGVEYVEIRSLDLDPFSSAGVNQMQLDFMECLLLHCVLSDSPAIGPIEQVDIAANDNLVASRGREPELRLVSQGQSVRLQDWASQIGDQLFAVADALDSVSGQNNYRLAIAHQIERIVDPEQTPSAQILKILEQSDLTYYAFGLQRALAMANDYRTQVTLDASVKNSLEELALQSLAKAAEVQANDKLNFTDYLDQYFLRSFE